jgi:8-oxo-dGTP diphosphatase
MKNYVVGFMFCKEVDKIVLIKKNRPQWQKDQWNGVGGHIESYEKPMDAMIREFREESGVNCDEWNNFLTRMYLTVFSQ